MFDPSISFNLDMMALEAGMAMYEIENGITDEYLRASCPSDLDGDSSATEGASFMDGLFTDDFVATEGFKETMGKVGKGLKAALITIGGAIKKVFVSLGTKIKAFFQAALEKFQRAQAKRNPYVAEISKDGDISELRATVTTAFSDATGVITASSQKIMVFVKKLNGILNKAAIGNSKKTTVSEDDLAGIANSYANSAQMKNRNDESSTGVAIAELNSVEETIVTLEKTYNNLKKNIDDINTQAKALGDNAKIKGEKTNSKGETKETKFGKKRTPQLVMAAIIQDLNLAPINNVAKSVTTQCSVHVKACEAIVNTAGKVYDGENDAAKAGYRMCQMYLQSSRIFSQISMACNNLFVFKVATLGDIDSINPVPEDFAG